MSILIDKSTRLIVQGITGRDGLFHAKKMKEYMLLEELLRAKEEQM